MSGPPALTRASVESAPLLAALHALCFDDPWTMDSMESLLCTPGTWALIAADPEPQGFIMIRQAADEAEILTLAVQPAARRRGIGAVLVGGAIAGVGETGARALYLEVATDNEAARALYARFGFLSVGTRKGYYVRRRARGPGRPADALILKRTILPDFEA